jgi:N-acetylneuraminic acid mutarotase
MRILTELMSPHVSVLLSVGGQPGTGAYANWISYVYLRPDVAVADEIGVWRIAPTGKLPMGVAGLGVAHSGERVYVIGGSDGSGQYHSDVLSAQFDFGQP